MRLKTTQGFTLIELMVSCAILAALALLVLPMSENLVKRSEEMELRRSLRLIRSAIDAYKADYDNAVAQKKIIATVGETGYPESLEILVEGVDWGDLYPYKKKYLRRLPQDPVDRYELGWGLRSYRDSHDSTVYGGEDVYDVYSQSDEIALDGTVYSTW